MLNYDPRATVSEECYPDREGNLAQWWDPVTSADAVDVVKHWVEALCAELDVPRTLAAIGVDGASAAYAVAVLATAVAGGLVWGLLSLA